MYNHKYIKSLLKLAQEIDDSNFDNKFPELIDLLKKIDTCKEIKGINLATLTSLISVVNSDIFIPACWKTFNSYFRDYFNIKIFWGGNTDYDKYSDILKTVRKVAKKSLE